MIIQAIGLLDDLDKELNTYAMRVKEWYGWHFPEMAKIVTDNLAYARVVCSSGLHPFLLPQLITMEMVVLHQQLPLPFHLKAHSATPQTYDQQLFPPTNHPGQVDGCAHQCQRCGV